MRHKKRNLYIALLLAVFTLFLATLIGCDQNDTHNIIFPESNVVASLNGRILSYHEHTSIIGAEWELVGFNQNGTSNDQGLITVENLYVGDFQLLVSAKGYATTRYTFTVDPNVFTLGRTVYHLQRNIYLIEKTSSLDLTIYQGEDGGPADGSIVDFLNWSFCKMISDWDYDCKYAHVVDDPNIPNTIQADPNGRITLSGVPGTRVILSVRPFDNNGDGMPEFRTTLSPIDLQPNTLSRYSIVLEKYLGLVEIVQTNLPTYEDSLRELPIFLLFSTGMNTDIDYTQVVLWKDGPYLEIPVTPVWVSETYLEISVPEDMIDDSERYELEIKAVSSGGISFQRYWDFRFDLVGQFVCEEVVNDLILSPETGEIDYNTTTLTLEWSAVACSGGYRIYAKDDHNNPNWVFLKEDLTDYEFGPVRANVNLPPQFDRYEVDNIQTPFAGIRVSFCVVPINAVNPIPGDPHVILELDDNTDPGIEEVNQFGPGVNYSDPPLYLSFSVQFTEYIDPNVTDPIITFINGDGGDPNFVLSFYEGSWKWDPGKKSGRFTFSLLGGQNGMDDIYKIEINNLKDLSGNIVPEEKTPWITIIQGRFDFESSGQGWIVSGQGWERGTPTVGPIGAHSGTDVWGTKLDDSYGNNWDTTLSSPWIDVPVSSPELTFWCWYSIECCYEDLCMLNIFVDSNIDTLYTYTGSNDRWDQKTFSLEDYAGKVIKIQFRFISDSDYSRYGFFLDDVEITGDIP